MLVYLGRLGESKHLECFIQEVYSILSTLSKRPITGRPVGMSFDLVSQVVKPYK